MKGMKRLLLSMMVLLSAALGAQAQQAYTFSQWSFDPYIINPAVAGLEGCLQIHGGYRMQWVGFENAPRSMYINGHRDFGRERSYKRGFHGFGATIMRDAQGAFEVISLTPSYAYHRRINKKYTLSMGLAVGFQQHSFRPDAANLPVGGDPLIGGTTAFYVWPEFKAGVWLKGKKGFAGLSMDNIYKTRIAGWSGAGIGSPSPFKKHYYLIAGKRIKSERWYITHEPSVLVKYAFLWPPSIDLSYKVYMADNLGFGAMWRNTDALIAMVEYNIAKKIRLAYAFDFTTSKVRLGSSNGHEFMFRYVHCFKNEVRSIPLCPAYD